MRSISDVTIWRIDDRDVITYVNDAWDRFALANEGGAARSGSVLRRSLWSFIVDEITRELYRSLLARVRLLNREATFSLRCDSPSMRRLLEMRVLPLEDDAVEFRTRLLERQPRPAQPIASPSPPAHDAREPIRACGWCKKIFVDGGWVEIEEAVRRLELFHRAPMPPITHGICDVCRQAMLETLARV